MTEFAPPHACLAQTVRIVDDRTVSETLSQPNHPGVSAQASDHVFAEPSERSQPKHPTLYQPNHTLKKLSFWSFRIEKYRKTQGFLM
jgi:hypothetical protein